MVRNVFCRFYAGCLTLAVHRGWDDWTCARCALRGEAEVPKAQNYATNRPGDE